MSIGSCSKDYGRETWRINCIIKGFTIFLSLAIVLNMGRVISCRQIKEGRI